MPIHEAKVFLAAFHTRVLSLLKDTAWGFSRCTRTQAAGLYRKGEGILSASEISFLNVTRHSYTFTDFHLNQQQANCTFIWLDIGPALFGEIGLHITGTVLVKGNLCFNKKSWRWKETSVIKANTIWDQDSQGMDLISGCLVQSQPDFSW